MSAPSETTYSGSCHCGRVKYQIDLPVDSSTWDISKCNCTICHKKGYLGISPRNNATFALVSPASIDQVGDYTFGSGSMHHRFCKECGTGVFARGHIEVLGGDWIMINVLTLDDVDLSKTKVKKYWDGRAEKWADGPKPEPTAPGQW